jgi:hypothetical protein
MSRGNRRVQPRVRQTPSSGTRPALTRTTDLGPVPAAEAFSALELEFFRRGDELEATPVRPDPPDDDAGGDSLWAVPAAEPS